MLKSHTSSSEAVGGGDAAQGTEGRAVGAHGRGDGAPVAAYTENFKAKITLPDLCSARRDKVLLTSLLRAHQGGNCKSPAAIYRGRFPLQNPESRRAGLGPWLRGHALPRSSSAGNAEIMISFAVGFGSAGEGAAGSALCPGHSAGGTGLRMDGHQLHAKVHLSPQTLAPCNPPPPAMPLPSCSIPGPSLCLPSGRLEPSHDPILGIRCMCRATTCSPALVLLHPCGHGVPPLPILAPSPAVHQMVP